MAARESTASDGPTALVSGIVGDGSLVTLSLCHSINRNALQSGAVSIFVDAKENSTIVSLSRVGAGGARLHADDASVFDVNDTIGERNHTRIVRHHQHAAR